MWVNTKIVIDMETLEVIEREGYWYDGPVVEMKGDGKKKADQQLALQNKLVQQALAEQKKFTGPVYENLLKYLTGEIGFNPQQVALMEGQFLDDSAGRFNDAGSEVRKALLRRGSGGGELPVGGDFVKMIAGLAGQKASSEASGLRDIKLKNLYQALLNKFNAAQTFMGGGAMQGQNIGTFNSGASNALNQYVQAASQPGWGSKLLGAAIGAGGSFLTGGLSNVLGGGSFFKPAASSGWM